MSKLTILWKSVITNWKTSVIGTAGAATTFIVNQLDALGIHLSTSRVAWLNGIILSLFVWILGLVSKDGDAPKPQKPEV